MEQLWTPLDAPPSQDDFFNDLKNIPLSDEHYAVVVNAWKQHKMKNIGDLLNWYIILELTICTTLYVYRYVGTTRATLVHSYRLRRSSTTFGVKRASVRSAVAR